MTLIISCLTEDWVWQVSDRRLTRLADGSPLEDDRNKAVVFCNRLAIAYTGLSEISPGRRTDEWLAQSLLDERCETIDRALQVIAARATEEVALLSLRRPDKRHAFVGVGWTRSGPEKPYLPIYCCVTNAQTPEGKWLTDADDEFRASVRIGTEGARFAVHSTGVDLTGVERTDLANGINACLTNGADPREVLTHLVSAVAKVADREKRVGYNLMAIALPRLGIQQGSGMLISGGPTPDVATFEYVAPGRTDGAQFGPHVVCGGSGALDFQFAAADPPRPGDGTVSMRIAVPRDVETELEGEIRRLWGQIDAASRRGRYPRIIELCKRVIRKLNGRTFAKNPGFFIRALIVTQYQLADAYIELGDYAAMESIYLDALASLERCTGIEPRDYELRILNNLAVLRLRQHRFTDAVQRCDEVLAAARKVDPARTSAWSYEDLRSTAGEHFGTSLARSISKALRNKAVALLEQGLRDEALAVRVELEQSMRGADDSEIQERIDFLRACLAPEFRNN